MMVLIIVHVNISEMNLINICEYVKLCFMKIVYANIINYNFINCFMCFYTYLVHKCRKKRFGSFHKSCKSSFCIRKLSCVVLNWFFKTFLFPV